MADERKVRMTSVLGETAVVIGNVKGSGDLEVRGKVQGSVLVKGRVLVAETGTVLGGVEANHITVEGLVRGDLVATEGVAVTASGHVEGNITAPRVGIDSGACVRGHLRTGASPADTPEAEAPALAPRNAAPTAPGAARSSLNAEVNTPHAVPDTPNAAQYMPPEAIVHRAQEETDERVSLAGRHGPLLESLPPRELPTNEAASSGRSGRSRPGKRRRGKRSDHEGTAPSGATWRADSGPQNPDMSARPSLRTASEFKSTEARQGPPKPLTFVKGAKGHPRG